MDTIAKANKNTFFRKITEKKAAGIEQKRSKHRHTKQQQQNKNKTSMKTSVLAKKNKKTVKTYWQEERDWNKRLRRSFMDKATKNLC